MKFIEGQACGFHQCRRVGLMLFAKDRWFILSTRSYVFLPTGGLLYLLLIVNSFIMAGINFFFMFTICFYSTVGLQCTRICYMVPPLTSTVYTYSHTWISLLFILGWIFQAHSVQTTRAQSLLMRNLGPLRNDVLRPFDVIAICRSVSRREGCRRENMSECARKRKTKKRTRITEEYLEIGRR